jgi:hypothetical protein
MGHTSPTPPERNAGSYPRSAEHTPFEPYARSSDNNSARLRNRARLAIPVGAHRLSISYDPDAGCLGWSDRRPDGSESAMVHSLDGIVDARTEHYGLWDNATGIGA